MTGGAGASAPAPRGALVRRHRLSTRLWHWINAVTLLVMLMSGLMIFNAHPRLYWGEYGANRDTPWLRIGSARTGGREIGLRSDDLVLVQRVRLVGLALVEAVK